MRCEEIRYFPQRRRFQAVRDKPTCETEGPGCTDRKCHVARAGATHERPSRRFSVDIISKVPLHWTPRSVGVFLIRPASKSTGGWSSKRRPSVRTANSKDRRHAERGLTQHVDGTRRVSVTGMAGVSGTCREPTAPTRTIILRVAGLRAGSARPANAHMPKDISYSLTSIPRAVPQIHRTQSCPKEGDCRACSPACLCYPLTYARPGVKLTRILAPTDLGRCGQYGRCIPFRSTGEGA